jgi:NAD(P)-dependent dehydrogenase (short-subunit alcohol dehydrogenase family)
MDLDVADNTALVTASSSGLGKGAARALCREGANVVICGRDAERLATAEAALETVADSDSVLGVQADLTDRADVESLVSTTVAEYGGIDHVVTSAGGPPSGPFLSTEDGDWYAAFDQLVMSVVWTLRFAHPHLVESTDASVVAITSKSVREAIDGLVLSNSVRRAVLGIVKTLAREWGPAVRVNAVLPGTHETARIEELIEQGLERGEYDSYEEGLADRASGQAIDEIGDPGAFGDAVAFLASPRAEFITGIELPVDGGSLRS